MVARYANVTDSHSIYEHNTSEFGAGVWIVGISTYIGTNITFDNN